MVYIKPMKSRFIASTQATFDIEVLRTYNTQRLQCSIYIQDAAIPPTSNLISRSLQISDCRLSQREERKELASINNT